MVPECSTDVFSMLYYGGGQPKTTLLDYTVFLCMMLFPAISWIPFSVGVAVVAHDVMCRKQVNSFCLSV